MHFPPNVIIQLQRSACVRCQICGDHGYNGEGAHIVSEKKDGPRSYTEYDEYKNLSEDELKKILNRADNGLFLCPTCHKMIDDKKSPAYTKKYTRDQLIKIKINTSKLRFLGNPYTIIYRTYLFNKFYDLFSGNVMPIDKFQTLCDDLFDNVYDDDYLYFFQWFYNKLPSIRTQFTIDHFIIVVEGTCDFISHNVNVIDNKIIQEIWELIIELIPEYITYSISKNKGRHTNLLKLYIKLYVLSNNKQMIRITELLHWCVDTYYKNDIYLHTYVKYIIDCGNHLKTNKNDFDIIDNADPLLKLDDIIIGRFGRGNYIETKKIVLKLKKPPLETIKLF